MHNTKLAYPVHTLDGKEIVPAGVYLTEEILMALRQACTESFEQFSLFNHDSVAADIHEYMHNPPYDQIFNHQQHTDTLFQMMNKVRVIPPVLDSLDYFKTNDHHTYRHMLMVFVLSCFFGNHLIPKFKERIQDAAAGPTHDIGKINVPLSIISKKGALTRSEMHIMRYHTLAGYCLLNYYLKDDGHVAARVARDHHERKDGSGYIRGITKIGPMVETVIVSDVYDALLSPRPYRPKSYDNRSAVEIITEMAEKGEIGWDIVKVLVSQNRADKPDYREIEVSLEKRGKSPEGNLYGIIEDE